jgi:putative transposase
MSRIARVAVPDVPYHITQRGNGRRIVFYNDVDRQTYLRLLARSAAEHRMNIQAYCLMGNHVHLVAVPQRADSLARALGRAHADFARYRNVSDGSCGHVWQSRYFSCPLDWAHLWRAIAYVERNPVRAGMVEAAEEYRWSSARARLGGPGTEAFLDLGEWWGRYDPPRWREVLGSAVDEAAFQRQLRDASIRGRALGSEEFVEQLERQTGRRLRPKPPGRPRKQVAAEQMSFENGI